MKPAPFRYADPGTLDEALAVLSSEGEGAKVLAGGQSLLPLLSMRLAALGRNGEARLYFERVLSEFPKSMYADRAKQRLGTVKA